MIIESQTLAEDISKRRYQARHCVTIDVRGTLYYFTSHADVVTPDPANTFAGRTVKLSSTSQKNTPEKRISTIGDFTFQLSDKGHVVTSWLRDRDLNDEGLRNAKIQLLIGSAGLDYSEYAPAVTQYIKRLSHNDRSYTFKASDIQRFVSKTIFTDLRQTNLAADLSASLDDDTITVISTDGFDLVAHSNSYKDGTAGQTVGYLYLEGEDGNGLKFSEVITYTGKTANSFTGCTRGALNTRPYAWAGPNGTNAGVVVKEHVFLQMPGPKMAWALMTGELYGQPGERLPDHWHAGVSASALSLSSFENYGFDFWNPADDSQTFSVRFDGHENENSKAFIEREILPLIGGSLEILGTGELALSRAAGVLTDAQPAMILTENEIVDVGDFERNLEAIENQFLIGYGWRRDLKEFKRKHGFIDGDSVTRNGLSTKVSYYAFKGLHYSDHSRDLIQNLMTPLRDRTGNETLRVTITARLPAARARVSQAIGIHLQSWQDYTSSAEINRSFEVQQVTVDWLLGRVNLALFGTSQRAAPIPAVQTALASPIDHTGWTELTSVLAPGSFTDDNGTLTIIANNDLTGFANAAVNGVVTEGWYYNGDVVFAGGTITTCSGHFILDANDISVFGDLDTSAGGILIDSDNSYTSYAAGLLGGPANNGVKTYASRSITEGSSDRVNVSAQGYLFEHDPKTLNNVAPVVNDSGQVTGIPDILHGQPGTSSEPSRSADRNRTTDQETIVEDTNYGRGGQSGGGVLLICNHLYGEGIGRIITSGEDGQAPAAPLNASFSVSDNRTVNVSVWASNGGGGYPGALLVLQKTNDAIADLNTLLDARMGASGFAGGAEVISKDPENVQYDGMLVSKELFKWYSTGVRTHIENSVLSAGHRGFASAVAAARALEGGRIFGGFEAGRVVYLADTQGDEAQPGDEPITDAQPVAGLALAREPDQTNKLLNATILTATATPPTGDTSYSHSLFEIRNVTTDSPWQEISYKTPNEATVSVSSDGHVFEVRARSVNTEGVVSETERTAQITAYLITDDPTTSDGGQPGAPDELKLADITGLELVNRVGDAGAEQLQFKSGNAEFKWNKTAASFNGRGISLDAHFAGYVIEIYRVNGDTSTTKVRDIVTEENQYTYTFEQNLKDNCGRKFQFRILAASNSGYRTPVAQLEVENPAPAAPSNVTVESGFTGFKIRFDRPQNDVDFVGVDVFIAPGAGGDVYSEVAGVEFTGNNFSIDELDPGTTYKLGLRSRDQFGTGAQIAQLGIVTNTVPGATVTEITGPVTINDNAGWLATDNAGYQMFLGAIDRPSVSLTTLILHAWDSIAEESSFSVDVTGKMRATGASIATSASGARTEINADSDNLRAFSPQGAEILTVGFGAVEGDFDILRVNTSDAYDAGDSFGSNCYPAYVYSRVPSSVTNNRAVYGYARGGTNVRGGYFLAADSTSNSGAIHGVHATADQFSENRNIRQYGVYGASVHSNTGSNSYSYGGYFTASGGRYAYGIYAAASGGSSSTYAAYLDGNVAVWGQLIVNGRRLDTLTQRSTRTSTGTWSITGLTIGRPLVIGFDANGQSSASSMSFRVTGGATVGRHTGSSSRYFRLGLGTSSDGRGGFSETIIPTSSTVTIQVHLETGACTLRAFQ